MDEATIELKCIQLPDDPDEVEVTRTEETRAQRELARDIAERHGARHNFTEHYDFGESCLYGDGYLYVPVDRVEAVATELADEEIEFDHIDFPRGADLDVVRRVRRLVEERALPVIVDSD